MNETTPKYITELEKRLINKIDKLAIEIVSTTSKGFTNVQGQINALETKVDKLETRFNGLETRFDEIETRFDDLEYKVNNIEDTMATKKDTDKILKHIGLYEIRAKNIEQILLKDHKPRIVDLEKAVFV